MAKRVSKIDEPDGKYINPLTDFGFKHIFGDKELLIDFLNAVLKIKGDIIDLHYDNPEIPGSSEKDRTTIFDLYCTTGSGESIIIEMQNQSHTYFVDRIIYYTSRLIQEQGENKKGDETWNFELNPVYSVNIVNFKVRKRKNKQANEYISYAHLSYDDDKQVVYEKLSFVFLELPNFKKKEHELDGNIDKWMFTLRNLTRLNNLPDALRNRIFEKLFLKAEIAKLTKEERKKYNQSLKKFREMNLAVRDRDLIIRDIKRDRDLKIRDIKRDRDLKIRDRDLLIKNKDQRIAELEYLLSLNGVSQLKNGENKTKRLLN